MLRGICMAMSNIVWGYFAEHHFTITLMIIGTFIIVLGVFSKAQDEHFLE